MMQYKESTSNGEQRNNIFIISVKSFALKIKLVRCLKSDPIYPTIKNIK